MPLDFIALFGLLHLIGTFAGVAYSTFAEIFYIKAASDGVVDKHERKYLRRLFRALSIATPVVVISSIALIVLEYLIPGGQQDVATAQFWAAQTLIVAIVLFGRTLEKRQTPWWVASSAMLVGWWMLLAIDLGYLASFGYTAIIMFYILLTFLAAGVIGYVRLWFWHPHMRKEGSE